MWGKTRERGGGQKRVKTKASGKTSGSEAAVTGSEPTSVRTGAVHYTSAVARSHPRRVSDTHLAAARIKVPEQHPSPSTGDEASV